MDPISFHPIYKQRIWGGRALEDVYQRTLPSADEPYGESWEISDRVNDQSVITNGTYAGKTLNQIWQNHREEVFGKNLPDSDRFPLLFKILDSSSDLSLQVHPPTESALALGGESKTEMWYIAQADLGAKLHVGLKKGVSKEEFETAIFEGTVAEKVHTLSPETGDHLHLDSGRLHAIGAGFLIYEIQQNSDTTYRVFDWNRMGFDGTPRELHIAESLACIDFSDHEPCMGEAVGTTISHCPHFTVNKHTASSGSLFRQQSPDYFAIITVIQGSITDSSGNTYTPGTFFLLPAQASTLTCSEEVTYLETVIPR